MMKKCQQLFFLGAIFKKTDRLSRNHYCHRFLTTRTATPEKSNVFYGPRRHYLCSSSSVEQGIVASGHQVQNVAVVGSKNIKLDPGPEKATPQPLNAGLVPADTEYGTDVDHFEKDTARLPDQAQSTDSVSGTAFQINDFIFDEAMVTPVLPSSASLVSFVAHSHTLQELLKLGVNLHKLDQQPDVANFLIKLNFERDIKSKIAFLTNFGIDPSDIGPIITKNPYLLREEDHNLIVRTKYLASKKFTLENIGDIIKRAPGFLSLNLKQIDQRLGMLQKSFHYTGDEIRSVITAHPLLTVWSEHELRNHIKLFKEQLMFEGSELKSMVREFPKLLTIGVSRINVIFNYLFNTLGMKRSLMVKQPRVFNASRMRLSDRHHFLQHLGKAQYDPTQSSYVPLSAIAVGSDTEFCEQFVNCSVQEYNDFLKTM